MEDTLLEFLFETVLWVGLEPNLFVAAVRSFLYGIRPAE